MKVATLPLSLHGNERLIWCINGSLLRRKLHEQLLRYQLFESLYCKKEGKNFQFNEIGHWLNKSFNHERSTVRYFKKEQPMFYRYNKRLLVYYIAWITTANARRTFLLKEIIKSELGRSAWSLENTFILNPSAVGDTLRTANTLENEVDYTENLLLLYNMCYSLCNVCVQSED